MTSIDAERLAIRECGKPKRHRIDRDRIIRLWQMEKWTQQSIADACHCCITTVRKVLREEGFEATYSGDGWGYKIMQHERADVLRGRRYAEA